MRMDQRVGNTNATEVCGSQTVSRYPVRVSKSPLLSLQPVRVYPPSTDRTPGAARLAAARCAPRCKMLISALASQTLIYPRAELRVAPRPLSLGLSTSARRARFACMLTMRVEAALTI